MPRLAACHVCRVLTGLPDPPASARKVPARVAWIEDGRTVDYVFMDPDTNLPVMVAEYDPALEDWLQRHEHAEVGDSLDKHQLYAADGEAFAAGFMASLKKELKDSHGGMYSERDELKDDAMKCFNEHHRPTSSCIDVFDESKIIGGHLSNKHMKKSDKMYLCHACPFVHGYVIPDVRHKKGYYK